MSAIPFNKPFIVGDELDYMARAVRDGQLAGNGAFTKKCEAWMQDTFGAKRVLLAHSCTAALEMAAVLADIGPGDEVIMPSFTFVSTANAFVLRGARMAFVDVRKDTFNLDESLIEQAITDRTKAIVPVHYGGVACEMDRIMTIAREHNLLVIEDAAQAVKAKYRDEYLGTIGHLGAYSFHETKNFISGEGGALAVNDARMIERAEIIRDKGTNRAGFFRGEVDKYTWVDVGSSYLPSELVAAFLYAQLEKADVITLKRERIHDYYAERLAGLLANGKLSTQQVPPEAKHNAHLFCILTEEAETRDRLLHFLRQNGIHAVFHYVPLHSSPMGERCGYRAGDLPVTENVSARLIRLPCYFELTRADQDRVVDAIQAFFE